MYYFCVGRYSSHLLRATGIECRWRARFFRTRPDQPCGPPSLLYNGHRVIPGGKATGAWRLSLTPSSFEVEERIQLYLYSPPLCLHGTSYNELYLLFIYFCFQRQSYHLKVRYVHIYAAVAQWLRYCATNRKVAGSIPDGVIGIFH
jgi:hypothetical protein